MTAATSTKSVDMIDSAPDSVTALPTLQQVIALAIAKLAHDLWLAIETMRNDEDARDEDADADVTLRLAGEAVTRMKAMTFTDYSDFAGQWFLVAAAIKLAAKAHSRIDSYFGRLLICARDDAEVLPELVEFVQSHGSGQARKKA